MAELDNIQKLINNVNIAEEIDATELDIIARDVIDGFDRDEDSRRGWLEKNEEYLKLASQVVENKSWPWNNASNIKYPLLTNAAISFGARIYPALVPSKNIVKMKVVGEDHTGEKIKSAERVQKHMSYQILEEMPEWEQDMDRLTIITPITGCAFKKTYHNASKKKNVSELILPRDLVVDYYASTLESAERITHILEFSPNDLHERVARGDFLDIDLGTPSINTTRKRTRDEIQGTKPPVPTADDPRILLEQHTYLDLDDDGYKEPYIITVDYNDRKVLRIVARFEIDSIELNAKEEVVRIEPLHFFTKFGFIPNPDGGFYDIGFGHLLGPINKSVNTLINQLVDAGTLSNLQSGYISRGIRVKGGKHRFTPGEWKITSSSNMDIKNGIVPLPVREPSMVLFSLLGMMIESGERMAAIKDVLAGESPGQNQAATTTLAVVEQGLKVFSAIHKRFHKSLSLEYQKLYELNRLHITADTYFAMLDSDEPSEQIYAQDYQAEDYNIRAASDPTIITETQRMLRAQGLLEMQQMGIELNQVELRKRVLEAQGQPNIEALIAPNPPQPTPPEIQLAMDEFEHKQLYETEMLEIQRTRADNEAVKDEAVGILALAKADAEDSKRSLEEFKQELQSLHSLIAAQKQQAKEALELKKQQEAQEQQQQAPTNQGV